MQDHATDSGVRSYVQLLFNITKQFDVLEILSLEEYIRQETDLVELPDLEKKHIHAQMSGESDT